MFIYVRIWDGSSRAQPAGSSKCRFSSFPLRERKKLEELYSFDSCIERKNKGFLTVIRHLLWTPGQNVTVTADHMRKGTSEWFCVCLIFLVVPVVPFGSSVVCS